MARGDAQRRPHRCGWARGENKNRNQRTSAMNNKEKEKVDEAEEKEEAAEDQEYAEIPRTRCGFA